MTIQPKSIIHCLGSVILYSSKTYKATASTKRGMLSVEARPGVWVDVAKCRVSEVVEPLFGLKPFTCIGYFKSDPCQPFIHRVMATDALSAIKMGEEAAAKDLGEPISSDDPYINTFVLAGHTEVLSSWAG